MEKKILFYCYWLGLACVAIAIVWRAANFAGFFVRSVAPGVTLFYTSFYKGAFLFLLAAIATAQYIKAKQ